jgi:hypothetical protein
MILIKDREKSMFQIMRIPRYMTGRDTRTLNESDAYSMFEFERKNDAEECLKLLVSFTTNPPPPMESSVLPYHFIKVA